MTRKQALLRAIHTLSDNSENNEVVQLLQDLHDELPLIHWSDKSIRDTVAQFILDNGRTPTASDFKRRGMPPHPVIKQKYNLTLAEWLDQNYPTYRSPREEIVAKHTEAFINNYYKIKPRSQREFNSNRENGTRGWQTIASYYGVKSWRKLLKTLELPLYFDMCKDHAPAKIQINIYSDI